MKNLFIIGNGFDIHHSINSSYSDYREWLKGYDFDLYNKLCRLYDSYIPANTPQSLIDYAIKWQNMPYNEQEDYYIHFNL